MLDDKRPLCMSLNIKVIFAGFFCNSITCVALPCRAGHHTLLLAGHYAQRMGCRTLPAKLHHQL
jgi:hypothetical protein